MSRPYSIVSSPKQALAGKLVLGIENAGFFPEYMYTQAKNGGRFHMTGPGSEFHYETLRDHKKIACIAGGSGITPFMSMAAAMLDGTEDYEMILFYGARDREHIPYQKELKEMEQQGLKVIYVLSDETAEGYENGFITREILEKYVDVKEVTFFLCGPPAMYRFVLEELKPFHLPVKAVRKGASCCEDLPLSDPSVFRLTVRMRDKVYQTEARENETLLTAMERAGLNAPNKCRSGGCGFIHPCVTYPTGDMEIEVPL